jgi:hypothetical protein
VRINHRQTDFGIQCRLYTKQLILKNTTPDKMVRYIVRSLKTASEIFRNSFHHCVVPSKSQFCNDAP